MTEEEERRRRVLDLLMQVMNNRSRSHAVFTAPPRVIALMPTKPRPIEKTAAFYALRADDGRVAMCFAMDIAHLEEVANRLLPRAARIDTAILRSEWGTPFI